MAPGDRCHGSRFLVESTQESVGARLFEIDCEEVVSVPSYSEFCETLPGKAI